MSNYRRFAPSGLGSPLGLPQVEPVVQAVKLQEKLKENKKSRDGNPFLTRLSIKDWDYDPTVILQHLGVKNS